MRMSQGGLFAQQGLLRERHPRTALTVLQRWRGHGVALTVRYPHAVLECVKRVAQLLQLCYSRQ